MIYLTLFYEFFKIGLFSIGGGMATIPFINDFGLRTGLVTPAEVANMLAVAESTPGPIGINTATYVGYHAAGIPGAIIATLSEVLPSVIVVVIVAKLLKKFKDNKYVNAAFYGLRPASAGLITAACWSVATVTILDLSAFETGGFWGVFNLKQIIFAALLIFPVMKTKLHPLIFIAIGAVVGIVFDFV